MTTFSLGWEGTMRVQFENNMRALHAEWGRISEELRAVLGASCQLDEMALYFFDELDLFRWISVAVRHGWELYNQADDVVMTSPLPAMYDVRYWFLRHKDVPYRLEAMTIRKGFSPYHEVVRRKNDSAHYSLVHASFKVDNEEKFASAMFTLKGTGYEVLQNCSSTYGRFSYLRRESDTCPVKPRVNLRDGRKS